MTPAERDPHDVPDAEPADLTDPTTDPATDPTTDDAVRRLLAAVGPSEPVPDAVARRLDDALRELRADRARTSSTGLDQEQVGSTEAPSDELSARRRRRWPEVLVAAAALGVIGVGLGTVLGGGGDRQTAIHGTAEQDAAAGSAARPDNGAGDGAAAGSAPEALEVPGVTTPARLSSDTLAADVQQLEDLGLGSPVSEGWGVACVTPPAQGADQWLDVRLDGRRGLLLLRAPENGRRLAEVYACDGPRTQRAPADSPDGDTDGGSGGGSGGPIAFTTVVDR